LVNTHHCGDRIGLVFGAAGGSSPLTAGRGASMFPTSPMILKLIELHSYFGELGRLDQLALVLQAAASEGAHERPRAGRAAQRIAGRADTAVPWSRRSTAAPVDRRGSNINRLRLFSLRAETRDAVRDGNRPKLVFTKRENRVISPGLKASSPHAAETAAFARSRCLTASSWTSNLGQHVLAEAAHLGENSLGAVAAKTEIDCDHAEVA
jgi:hypothetical protein